MTRTDKVGYNRQDIRELGYVNSENHRGKQKLHVRKTTPEDCSFCTSKHVNHTGNKEIRKRVDDVNDRHTDRTYVPYNKVRH